MTPGGALRLVSGLSLTRETSFNRQLNLLGRAFGELGVSAEVSGPPYEDLYLPEGGTLAGVAGGLVEAGPAGREHPTAPRATILLGYPAQFPFVETWAQRRLEAPAFLWTQLSRPPKSSDLGFFRLVRPVALTERTWSFIAASVRRFYDGGIPIIPHGVDTTLFRPPDDDRREAIERLRCELELGDAFVVGTIAANTFRKRYDRMFEAFALFRKRLEASGRVSPKFVVKTDRIRGLDGRDLREMAVRLGIGQEVRFIERSLEERELSDLLALFDIYLNLSEWEGFCIPVIEAMACGVPVVSHDVQGPGELLPYADLIVPGSIRRTEAGVLLLDASAERAAEVLDHVYRDEALRRDSSRIGRRTALELYDIHRVAQAWLDLLDELPGSAR